MAAASSPIRLRLLFDYPPPSAAHCRRCWLLLDRSRCRVVADVESLVRERFDFSRGSIFSLFVDECYLPSTESVHVLRDNDCVSVKVDYISPPDDGVSNSPQTTTPDKRQKKQMRSACVGGEDGETVEEEKRKRKKKKKKTRGLTVTEGREGGEKKKKKKRQKVLREESELLESHDQPQQKVQRPSEKKKKGGGGAAQRAKLSATPLTLSSSKDSQRSSSTRAAPPSSSDSDSSSSAGETSQLSSKHLHNGLQPPHLTHRGAPPPPDPPEEEIQLLIHRPLQPPGRGRPTVPPGRGGARGRGLRTPNTSTNGVKERPAEGGAQTSVPQPPQNGAPPPPIQDYSCMPLLAGPPQVGQKIAFKLLELSESYTPEVSAYKEGTLVSFNSLTNQIELELQTMSPAPTGPGKFDLVYQNPDGSERVEYAVTRSNRLTERWESLLEPRLVIHSHTQDGLPSHSDGPSCS